jgi:hypothetical protein
MIAKWVPALMKEEKMKRVKDTGREDTLAERVGAILKVSIGRESRFRSQMILWVDMLKIRNPQLLDWQVMQTLVVVSGKWTLIQVSRRA